MSGHDERRTGLFVIRAWLEPGSPAPLRMHIRATTDVALGFEDSQTVHQVEAVVEAVQAWLAEMLADPGTP